LRADFEDRGRRGRRRTSGRRSGEMKGVGGVVLV